MANRKVTKRKKKSGAKVARKTTKRAAKGGTSKDVTLTLKVPANIMAKFETRLEGRKIGLADHLTKVIKSHASTLI